MAANFDKKRSSEHSACSDVTHLAGVTSCLLPDCALSVGISLRPEKVETTVKLANRKGVRLGLVAALAATGLVGVTSLTASGQTSPPTQERVGELVLTVPGGSVRTATVEVFETDTDGVRLDQPAVLTQVFTATAACPTLESTGDFVLDISATPAGIPVLPNNGIGVTDNTSCGASGAVVAGEALSLALANDTSAPLTELFGGDVDVRGGSITVFRDPGGGNLTVGFDGKTPPSQLGTPLVNGLNTPRTFTDRFENSIQISSTSQNSNKGIYLRGATFTLWRDIQNNAPDANFTFTPDLLITPIGLTVNFTDTSTDPDGNDTIVKWEWTFGDGNTTTVLRTDPGFTNGNATHTYTTAGNYPVTLRVTDNLGGTDITETQPVIANQAPTADFTFAPNGLITPIGLTVNFTDTSTDPDGNDTIVKWEWTFGDGNTTTVLRTDPGFTNGNATHTYTTAGNYPVTLRVTDNLGGTDITETQPVIANQAPVANFTSLADGRTVDFTDTSTDPDGNDTIVKWEWTFGDGNTTTVLRTDPGFTNGNATNMYATSGDYEVTLTVTDNLGGTDDITKTVGAYEQAVFCSKAVSGSGTTATIDFRRGENGLKYADDCADVGVVVEVGTRPEVGDYVFWDNSFTGIDGTPQDVNGLVTITWLSIDPANSVDVAKMNNRQIDYTGFEDGIQLKPQSYCLEFEQTFIEGATPEEDTYKFEAVLPDWPEGDDDPGFILVGGEKKVPWCLVSDTRVVDEFGNITQTEVLYGRGDPIKPK
jgi:PKD repeat protein